MNLNVLFTPEMIGVIMAFGIGIGLLFMTLLTVYRVVLKPKNKDGLGRTTNLVLRTRQIASDPRTKTVATIALVALMIAVPQMRSFAQSIEIDFDAEDLDIFFTYFNMMFNALIGIALLGAGITAGGAFVWVLGQMLTNAFTRMLRGNA